MKVTLHAPWQSEKRMAGLWLDFGGYELMLL